MGASLSFHGPEHGALHDKHDGLTSQTSQTISFNDPDSKNIDCTLSSNFRNPEHSILKTLGSGRITIEGSLSFKGLKIDQFQVHTTFSKDSTSAEEKDSSRTSSFKSSATDATDEEPLTPSAAEAGNPTHEAAVKLQKVYKSFRTRRQLADCAVLVEQHWWRLLDFALLKQSSISYFNIEKPESVASRWSRARTRAAKVGKGLSKDEKAQKLALQHWLEAIDPRHRYGHNLHFYYASWLRCESKQPFFYWLDVGDGKEVNIERCPRSKLQQQCIKYLGPIEREDYEVIVEGGKLVYKKSQKLLDTFDDPKDSKWIFVLSTSKKLYVGKKKKGKFQHSSFLAGAATSSAGRLVVEKGVLKAVWPHSGHYRPTEKNFQEFVAFLNDNEVDLSDVKKHQTEGDNDDTWSRTASATHTRTDSYQLDLADDIAAYLAENFEKEDVVKMEFDLIAPENTSNDPEQTSIGPCSSPSISPCTSPSINYPLEHIESSKKEEAFNDLYALCAKKLLKGLDGESDEDGEEATNDGDVAESTDLSDSGGKTDDRESLLKNQYEDSEAAQLPSASEQCYRFQKINLFEENPEEKEEHAVHQELILHRINSKKGMKSLQLGRQLSCKWTTGAGPRIGCVRDYPSELQFLALEQVSLSPRSAGEKCFASSPRQMYVEVKL